MPDPIAKVAPVPDTLEIVMCPSCGKEVFAKFNSLFEQLIYMDHTKNVWSEDRQEVCDKSGSWVK